MFKLREKIRSLKEAFLRAIEPNIQGEYRYGVHLMEPPQYASEETKPFLALIAVNVDGKGDNLIEAQNVGPGTIETLKKKYPQATFVYDPEATMPLRDRLADDMEIAQAMAAAPRMF